jgi:5-methylcytosine-specific restriction protein A
MAAEQVTRAMLPEFLRRRGFTDVENVAVRNGQTLNAKDSTGRKLAMRVKLCWRREPGRRDSARSRTYSAAQILAKIGERDWIEALQQKVDSERSHGVTHMLFVQNEDETIIMAALIPLSSLIPIWIAQRDTSTRLIDSGRLGRRRKNHAMNGKSPTIWLQDDQAQEVAQELWEYPGVVNLAAISESLSFATLGDRDAVEPSDFDYTEEDQRKIIERQIRERRGQQVFREELRRIHGDRCMATRCSILAVLEAAHIKPYRGVKDNHAENGLLLRSDIHTLFDLDLLGIKPNDLTIEIHPSLVLEYGDLQGTRLALAGSARLSKKALQNRYERFKSRSALSSPM